MSLDRVSIVQGNLERFLAEAPKVQRRIGPDEPVRLGTTLTGRVALGIYEDQLLSRMADVEARRLKATGRSFYTISSAGHEQNAVLGTLLRTTDPCFLHYRSGGLMMARGRKLPELDMAFDTMLSVCASEDDPTAEGRHKVWGSRALWVPPQTSTIASHLPKAVGTAFAIGRARRMEIDPGIPEDAVVCCTFGDASANHATALTGFQAARYGSRRGNPMPILFVCEDNGLGISTDTPRRWIRESFGGHVNMKYVEADGELDEVWDSVEHAIELCRSTRAPTFLRLVTVRLWGHAGSDIETAYRSRSEIEATEAQDPLLRNARRLMELGVAGPEELSDLVTATAKRMRAAGEEGGRTRASGLGGARHRPPGAVRRSPGPSVRRGDGARRAETGVLGGRAARGGHGPGEAHHGRPYQRRARRRDAQAARDPRVRRGCGPEGRGVLRDRGLQKRFGQGRVFDTHLDETSILGLAQGSGLLGLLPVPEIQYLAYIHNAVDQIRGEASSLQFFSNGQFSNPMVVRVAGLAYQKGFGGHFHNDHSFGGLRDIPGLLMAVPSRGDDAVRMMRGCLAVARECGRVVAFLEPIALYHQRDLLEEGDEAWLFDYPSPGEVLLPGEVGLYGEGPLLIVSYANGLHMSLKARAELAAEHGIDARVLDLRWLNPLPFEAVRREAASASAVLVVDECRRTGGGIAEAVVADLAESGYGGVLRSVRAPDSFVPLGPAADTVLIQPEDIVRAAVALGQGAPA